MDFIRQTKLTDLKFIAIQLLFTITFGLTSFSKWAEGGIPEHFTDRFSDSLLNLFPGGLFVSYYAIAIIETFALVLFVISIFKMEWLTDNKKIYLESGLILSLFIFVILGFGLRLIGDQGGAANLFLYFGATLVALFLVEQVNKQ